MNISLGFRFPLLAAGLLALIVSGFVVEAVGDDSILVLRNGRVLRGRITSLGDSYVVVLGQGSDVRISKDAVDMHCQDLWEAYQRKRSRLPHDRPTAHLDLAEWCFQHSLYVGVEEQLALAQRLAPSDPRIARMQRRLQLAQDANQSRSTDPFSQGGRELAAPHGDPDPNEVVDQLSGDSVQRYVSSIQPFLVNRCGAAACHGGSGAATDYQLFNPHWGRTIPARLTQRNLLSTLEWVERGDPESSRLYQAARQPHGGSPVPPIRDGEVEYATLLADWIATLKTEDDAAPQDSPVADLPHVPPQEFHSRLEQLRLIEMAGGPRPTVASESGESGESGGATATGQQPLPSLGAPASEDATSRPGADDLRHAVDPFDPDIFNRRYVDSPRLRDRQELQIEDYRPTIQ